MQRSNFPSLFIQGFKLTFASKKKVNVNEKPYVTGYIFNSVNVLYSAHANHTLNFEMSTRSVLHMSELTWVPQTPNTLVEMNLHCCRSLLGHRNAEF